MALLVIKKYPDDILRENGEDVLTFDKALDRLVTDMIETMYVAEGVGLAAQQVGIARRVLVLDVSPEGNAPQEFINPRIVDSDGKVPSEEGCLSIPDFRETISRKERVIVEAQNRRGEFFTTEADGILSICLQHEIDHLNGVLFIDHMSRLKRDLFRRWFKRHGPFEGSEDA